MTKTQKTASFAILAGILLSEPLAAQGMLKNFPLAILCGRGENTTLAYLDSVSSDGTATYVSATGQSALTITTDGPATAAVEMASGSNCIGKTLEALRSEQRTVEVGG